MNSSSKLSHTVGSGGHNSILVNLILSQKKPTLAHWQIRFLSEVMMKPGGLLGGDHVESREAEKYSLTGKENDKLLSLQSLEDLSGPDVLLLVSS